MTCSNYLDKSKNMSENLKGYRGTVDYSKGMIPAELPVDMRFIMTTADQIFDTTSDVRDKYLLAAFLKRTDIGYYG